MFGLILIIVFVVLIINLFRKIDQNNSWYSPVFHYTEDEIDEYIDDLHMLEYMIEEEIEEADLYRMDVIDDYDSEFRDEFDFNDM